MSLLRVTILALTACCLVNAAHDSSRNIGAGGGNQHSLRQAVNGGSLDVTSLIESSESSRVGGVLGMLGISVLPGNDVKFGACKPTKPAAGPAKPTIPVPRGLEARIRTKYRTFFDAGPVVIGADSIIVDMVDASVKYHNSGMSTSFWLNAREGETSGTFSKEVPLKCLEDNYASFVLRVNNAIIVFKEPAGIVDPVRSILGDEIKIENLTLEARVAATVFGTYDVAGSKKVDGPVFRILDRASSDPANGFHFCLGDFKITSLKSSSSVAERLPSFLSWLRPTIASLMGSELKCALRYNQPDVVRLIHQAEDPSMYQLGFEAHTMGGVFMEGEETLSVDLSGLVKMDLPTNSLFSSIVWNAKSVLETLKETNTAESTHDIFHIEERLKDGETLRPEEYGSFIRAAANNLLFANNIDVASMEALVDYAVERFTDETSDFTLSLKKVKFKLENEVVGSAGPRTECNVGEALINFEGGEGYLPISLLLAKFAEIRERERLARACEQFLNRFQSLEDDEYSGLMQECLQFEMGDKSLDLDNVKEELAKEKYKMSGDLLARVRNWNLSGRLDDDFWKVLIEALCLPEDSGCRENVIILDDFLRSNVMGLLFSTGDTDGDGEVGLHASKTKLSAHIGTSFFGSIPVSTIVAMASNWPRFLLDHLKSIHAKRRIEQRLQSMVTSKLEGKLPAAVEEVVGIHRADSFVSAQSIGDDNSAYSEARIRENGDGASDAGEQDGGSLYDSGGMFSLPTVPVIYEE